LSDKQLNSFFKIIKIAFGGKRKQIINTLSKGLQINKNNLKTILNRVGIDEKSRPENLTTEMWINLLYSLKNMK